MRYQYVVNLKRNNDRSIDIFNILLCIMSVLAFVFEQIRTHTFNLLFTFASIAIITGTLVNIYFAIKKNKLVRYRYLLLVSGVSWICMPYLPWLSILFFILSFLEYQVKYPLEVGFTNDEVVINTLIKRKFNWSAFNNIVLKDGLLTLDFKNNKLFQKEALDDDEPDADEDEFNEYCRECLLLTAQGSRHKAQE
jgi:hypothetical protein